MEEKQTDDIAMTELEDLVNKKKLKESSVNIPIVPEVPEVRESVVASVSSSAPTSKKSKSSKISSKSSLPKQKRKEDKQEKMDLYYKLVALISKSNGKYSTYVTQDSSLEEIQVEFSRIKKAFENDSMVKFCKHGLIMGIKGLEMLNTSYDPFGIDLDGWGESMSYNMATNEYDEVLADLCEKYKGVGNISPELKLCVMIAMSGAMFAFTKKASKDPVALNSIIDSLMKKQPRKQPVVEESESEDAEPSKIQSPKFEPSDITGIMNKIREQNNTKNVIEVPVKKARRGRPPKNKEFNIT
jgi:hypothetical protein